MLWRAPLFQTKKGDTNMGNVNMEASQINDRTGSSKMSVAQHLKALDAIASAIEGLPTFTSNDRAFLEELPAFPSEDGKKALVATTESGETSLSYESIPDELPADPESDGKRVLTATTSGGTTTKSWEMQQAGENQTFSTTAVKIGSFVNQNLYRVVIQSSGTISLTSGTETETGFTLGNNEDLKFLFPYCVASTEKVVPPMSYKVNYQGKVVVTPQASGEIKGYVIYFVKR